MRENQNLQKKNSFYMRNGVYQCYHFFSLYIKSHAFKKIKKTSVSDGNAYESKKAQEGNGQKRSSNLALLVLA